MKVSVIIPCTSRPDDLPKAIELFKNQTYVDKELIIVGDVPANIIDGITERVVTINGYEGKKVGAIRNAAIRYAHGDIIAHQDSDDWYAPNWIAHSVAFLQASGAVITGLDSAYFYKHPKNMWLYKYNGGQPYVIGASMVYYKRVWEAKQFMDIQIGEDLIFQTNAGRVMAHDYIDGFIAMIHRNNTGSHTQVSGMKRINPLIAQNILGESYYL